MFASSLSLILHLLSGVSTSHPRSVGTVYRQIGDGGRLAMDTPKSGPFELVSHRLGALPIVNPFLDRMGLYALLARWLPAPDRRFRLDPAVAIRLVVINLLVGRAPLYGLGEWAAPYAPALLHLGDGDAAWLNDDRVGRALVRL